MPENLHFYKFKPINKWTIESIINSEIFASKPENLNDPFDCQVDIEDVFRRAISMASGRQQSFLKLFHDKKEFFENWNREMKSKGVYSFSLKNTDVLFEPLMWSHYADAHRGICLEYIIDEKFIRENFMAADAANRLTIANKVDYKEGGFVDSVLNAPQDMKALVTILLQKYLLTKSPSWSYEKEGRLVFQNSDAIKIPKNALHRVYFGLRSSASDIELIKKLAKNYSDCNSFHKIKKGVGDYALESEEIFY